MQLSHGYEEHERGSCQELGCGADTTAVYTSSTKASIVSDKKRPALRADIAPVNQDPVTKLKVLLKGAPLTAPLIVIWYVVFGFIVASAET